MRMTQLHSAGTVWINRSKTRTKDGYHPAWEGHAYKEMKKRRAHNKVAKQARKVNRVR